MEMVEEASRESVSKSSREGYLMEMVEEASRESVSNSKSIVIILAIIEIQTSLLNFSKVFFLL